MFVSLVRNRRAKVFALAAVSVFASACTESPTSAALDAQHVDAQGDSSDASADDRASVDTLTDAPDDVRCPNEATRCGGECVDTRATQAHCGSCDVACGLRESCVDGRCVCASGRTRCGTTCVDLQTSGTHCGRCDLACDMGQVCGAGVCACLPGRALCPSTGCTSLAFDQGNCGACGNRCAPLQRCVEGECM